MPSFPVKVLNAPFLKRFNPPPSGCYPKCSVRIAGNRPHNAIRGAVFGGIGVELARGKMAQSGACAHPQRAIDRILVYEQDAGSG